jgi:hypothetical protein
VSLDDSAEVDGRDIGAAEMNIFIYTEHPAEVFLKAESAGAFWGRWPEVRAAYREATEDTYTVVWPPDLSEFTLS